MIAMEVEMIENPIVRAAIVAMKNRKRDAWIELFAENVTFTDDGHERSFKEWSHGELFNTSLPYLSSIDTVEDNGLTIYGKFHSSRWGDFKTFLSFQIDNHKITRLEVGPVNFKQVYL
jgi:hypothetical protein